MNNNIAIYEWESAKKLTRWLFCIGAFAASIICLFVIRFDINESGGKMFTKISGIVFGVCAIAFLIPGRTVIDIPNHVVRREILLFGKFLLYWRNLPFGNFSKVFIEFQEDLTNRQWDNYYVGLRFLSGRKLWIKYWNIRYGKPCPAAKELAENLSRDLGLPLEKIELVQTEGKIVN